KRAGRRSARTWRGSGRPSSRSSTPGYGRRGSRRMARRGPMAARRHLGSSRLPCSESELYVRERIRETMAMPAPLIAQPKPFLVAVEGGRTYFWCACGRSATQPFCDGSHRGTGYTPRKFVASCTEEVLLCGCKHSGDAPFCDGAHTNLPGGSPLDDPESPANRSVPVVTEREGPRRWLNGGCYIVSPALSMGDRELILFVVGGRGSVCISGREFEIKVNDGVYVRSGEALQLAPDGGETLQVFALAHPQGP